METPVEQQSVDMASLKAEVLDSLYAFAKGVLGFDWLDESIHLPVCQELQDPSTNRKLIVLPRGWLKTTICSIAFPIWLSCRNPNIRILLVQNSATNAAKKLSVIRNLWEQNPLLRALFPDLLPGVNNVWRGDALCLTRSASFPESTYESAGTSTRVVSRHYDVVIEDDTVAPEYDELGQESLAPSSDEVNKAIGWHRTNVLPLLNNPSKDLSLVVGTRWYDEDLIRWIMDNEPDYKVITRACKENDEGKADPNGHLTYPGRFDDKVLAQLEAALGPYMFYCLYYNLPVRREDMAFKMEWFRYYENHPALQSLAIYTTIDGATDPALAKDTDIDYFVVMTCGKDLCTGDIYVLDYFHKRCSPGEFCSAIFDQVRKWRPICVGYQDTTFEKSIDYWLKELMRQNSMFFILEPLKFSNRKDAKNLRISGLQPLFASGTIHIRTWMKDLVSELIKFPFGAHDDLPDALSMQLGLWRATKLSRQKKALEVNDPFSFESMMENIKSRSRSGPLSSVVFDPVRCDRSDMFMLLERHN